jgi:Beta-propeller repeat
MRKYTGIVVSAFAPWLLAAATPPQATRTLAQQPVRFEPSADGKRFVARGLHHSFVVTADGATMRAEAAPPVRIRFEGAQSGAALRGQDRLRSATNLLIGNDRTQWRSGIPNFARVTARNVYPNIDVVYYGSGAQLEYDFVVHPGGNPDQIRLRIDGTASHLDAEGNLIAGLVHNAPVTYQLASDGARIPIASRFRKTANGTYAIARNRYDRRRDLVIDPKVTLTAYLAGTLPDIATSIGHDAKGFLYVGGTTTSTDMTATDDAYQTTNKGGTDLFVAKINPTAPAGAQVVYTTYIGGSAADQLNDMAVGADGSVYLTGSTTSNDFPLGNAAQSTLSGTSDGFVLWLNPSLAGTDGLFYATYLGGTGDDAGTGIAVAPNGTIAVVGWTKSTDFLSSGGWQASNSGGQDAFVVMIDTTQSAGATIAYSTYLGGSGWDTANSVAAAPDSTIWVTGVTYSGDFPMTGNSYQSNYQTGGDVFLAHLDPRAAGGSSLLYTTYFGGSNVDEAKRIALDSSGRVIVAGYTLSSDLPISPNAIQGQLNGSEADAFVAVLNPAATGGASNQFVYASYLGGSGGDEAYDLVTDSAGNIYVTGLTKSTDFPVTSDALQRTLLGGPAGFVVKLNTARNAADYSSYITTAGNQTGYGIDVDKAGTIYVAGFTSGSMFDAVGGPSKPTDPGNVDAFVIGFGPSTPAASSASKQAPFHDGVVNRTR